MTEYPPNFAEYPESVAALRADREQKGNIWSPRDALIHLLKVIDSGQVSPTDLMLVYKHKISDGKFSYHYLAAAHDTPTAVGLLEIGKHLILKDD